MDIATERSKFQKDRKKPKGKLLHGHTYDHNPDQLRCGGSIPTRFQRILMPKDSALVRPNNRLDDNHFYKSLFNKEPGPGSYSLHSASISDIDFPSHSIKGYGNGFVSENSKMSTAPGSAGTSIYPDLGPGKYNTQAKRLKGLVTKVFSYCGRKGYDNDGILKLNIPFDENNPLNYIKPITLNVYVKPTLPGPGEYNVNPEKNLTNSAAVPFKSCIERIPEGPENAEKDQIPGVGYYNINSSSIKVGTENRQRSKSFMKSKKPTINYEWLGDGAEIVNKSYAETISKKQVEIVHYGKLHKAQALRTVKEKLENEKNEESQTGQEASQTAAFVLSDADRFGEQIRPKKPFEIRPGPGEYNADLKKTDKNQCAYVFKKRAKSTKSGSTKKQRMPGPAFYNPQKEPAKLSFHLNVAKKWV